jgi:spore germination protein
MEIYVVQQGDTINSIAQNFNISVVKLINDNGIELPYRLVVGQALVITRPIQVYTVMEGDSIISIAEAFQVTVMQLLRNNPDLTNRQYIYPGETIVIRYNNKEGEALIVGYTYPYIRDPILRMTLPYLNYLLIFNYRMTGDGELIGGDEDIAVIQTANLFETETTLVLTAYSETGEINLQDEYDVLLNQQTQDKIIDNLLSILELKGYTGVNLAFQFINSTNQQLYLNFLINVSNRLHPEGYSVFLTLNPGLSYNGDQVTFEKINYVDFSNASDGILFLSYDWGSIDRPPTQISIVTTSTLLDYIVAQVPLDKIRIGVPTLGYDWRLPYIPGQSKANSLNYSSVLRLASQTNSVIQYDENTLTAYFEYIDPNMEQHIVLFKDARSIDSSLQILQSYGIKGIGIWNIMYYFAQLWNVINSQYEIIKQ